MRILGTDVESSSACPIKAGAWAYSLDPSTIVLCVVFCFSSGPDDPKHYIAWEPGDELPEDVCEFIRAGGSPLAHNQGMEIAMWTHILEGFGFPPLPPSQWLDTQPLGLAMNFPASLDGLCSALGTAIQKDDTGSKLMLKMCKAKPNGEGGFLYPHRLHRPSRDRLVEYCKIDVGATIDAWWRLKRLSITEALVLDADTEINNRGVYLDLDFAAKCARMAEERREELDSSAWGITGGQLKNSRSPNALKNWMKSNGVQPPEVVRKKKQEDGTFRTTKSESVGKTSIKILLDNKDLCPEVRRVLTNRVESNKVTSLSKLQRIPEMVGTDGRLRNALQYCGAHTGRWTSHGLQLHNLAKDRMGPGVGDLVRYAIKTGNLELLKFAVERPLDAISQSIRSTVVAPPGFELVAADWSAIEARTVAWLSGQESILQLFRDNVDVYIAAANGVGSDMAVVGREFHRGLGKVLQLSCGYGMGGLKFYEKLLESGIVVDPKQAKAWLKKWREDNSHTRDFWYKLEDIVRDAISNPGEIFTLGFLSTIHADHCLYLRLPSGRMLRYWRPKIVKTTRTIQVLNDEGDVEDREMTSQEIRFFTPLRGKMSSETTYGGKLAENTASAVARDILAESLVRIRKVKPYRTVVHVHDSICTEVPTGGGSVDELCELMSAVPHWAPGLPLKAEGYRDTRFRG